MHTHWIEFLPEARALLAILILTARTILAIHTRQLRKVPSPHAAVDSAASSRSVMTSTSTPDRFSRMGGVVLQIAQVGAAALAVIDWLIKGSF